MTSVVGHIIATDFAGDARAWSGCAPIDLFQAQICKKVDESKNTVAKNIRDEAKRAQVLMIWTDCDREGEHIGVEVLNIAKEGNRNLTVKRAMFNNLEAQCVFFFGVLLLI